MSQNLVYLPGRKVRPGERTLQMEETRENIFTGHNANLPGHFEQDERKKLTWFFYIGNPQQSLSKSMLV